MILQLVYMCPVLSILQNSMHYLCGKFFRLTVIYTYFSRAKFSHEVHVLVIYLKVQKNHHYTCTYSGSIILFIIYFNLSFIILHVIQIQHNTREITNLNQKFEISNIFIGRIYQYIWKDIANVPN